VKGFRSAPIAEAYDELAPFWVYDLRRYEPCKPLPLRIVGKMFQSRSLRTMSEFGRGTQSRPGARRRAETTGTWSVLPLVFKTAQIKFH
jgi:hypothetical protein